jgi:hypothetical protein
MYSKMDTEVRTARDKEGRSRVVVTIAREELKEKLERGDEFFLLLTISKLSRSALPPRLFAWTCAV